MAILRLSARGAALFLGGFSLLNLLGRWFNPEFDGNGWWIDLQGLPTGVGMALLGLAGVALGAWAVRPVMGRGRRRVSRLLMLALGVALLINTIGYYLLLFRGQIQSRFPMPFTLILLLAVASIWRAMRADPAPVSRLRAVLIMGATLLACVVIFPLGQVICFGLTDYRRPADAIVVFGARAYADGTPSLALADRVRTGCELYQAGLAPVIIFSGGPGDGAVHETQAMRTLALRLGVEESAILLDPQGLNSRATIANLGDLLSSPHARVLAVSHFYHLPRIKLLAQQSSLRVYTVPARQSRLLRATPYFVLREVAGLWHHYALGFLRAGN